MGNRCERRTRRAVMSTEEILGLVVIGVFLLVRLVIGTLSALKSTATPGDYFVQGRAMGSVAVLVTVTATWWRACACLGSIDSCDLVGPLFWTALVWNILFGGMCYWSGYRVWFHGKRGNFLTARDFLVARSGSAKLAAF